MNPPFPSVGLDPLNAKYFKNRGLLNGLIITLGPSVK